MDTVIIMAPFLNLIAIAITWSGFIYRSSEVALLRREVANLKQDLEIKDQLTRFSAESYEAVISQLRAQLDGDDDPDPDPDDGERAPTRVLRAA